MNVNSQKLGKAIQKVLTFNKKRGWDPVASDLAKSITIESAELLEKFQWDSSSRNIEIDKTKDWDEIAMEIADVFWYIISFCNKSGIILEDALLTKIKKLEVKYPENMFKGKHNDKFYKEQKRKYRENRN